MNISTARLPTILCVLLSTGLAGQTHAAALNYIGVPEPDFGIEESAPEEPVGWPGQEVDGYYFIEESNASASDSNDFGSPSSPRRTVPRNVPAGAVVIISGRYSANHETNSLTLNGTSQSPVFIRGSESHSPAVITQKWIVSGSYYIIENIEGDWASSSVNGKLNVSGDHGVVRFGDFHGDRSRIGVGSVNVTGSNMVLFQNEISDSGLLDTAVDADTHGTRVSANSEYIWIVGNVYHHNSGDGIQINASNEASQSSLHHVYVAGNEFFENRQTGAWTKQAEHVIFSQNISHDHIQQPGGAGVGLGTQYAADYVWFLANRIYDNGGGIRVASDSGLGHGENHFIIGNLIYNNRRVSNFDSGNPYSTAGIGVWGSRNTVIASNTLSNNMGGIFSPRSAGSIQILSNIVSDDNGGNAYNIEFKEVMDNPDFNFFLSGQNVKLGNQSNGVSSYIAQSPNEQNSQVHPEQQFLNIGLGDYSLVEGSPAIDSGMQADAYDLFQSIYGISIRVDIDGNPRPAPDEWDVGAIENGDHIRPRSPGSLQ